MYNYFYIVDTGTLCAIEYALDPALIDAAPRRKPGGSALPERGRLFPTDGLSFLTAWDRIARYLEQVRGWARAGRSLGLPASEA
jgi:hypothetical protein